MINATLKRTMAAAGVAAMLTSVPASAMAGLTAQAPPVTTASTVNWQIALRGSSGYRKANGSAQFHSQPGQRDIQVEVQRVRALAGKTVVFSAGGIALGTAKVSSLGIADITCNTERGQKVPRVRHGSTVLVGTAGGKLIASGSF